MIDESILKLLKDSFSTSVQTVYIPTIGKTLRFREPTFKEQKTISKIVVANPDKQSVIYASTLAMISNLCLDDIDISSLNEYDRLKILAFLFSMNFFSKRLTITCPKCGKSFNYTVMHGDILRGMDSIDVDDVIFKAENKIGKIEVTLNFPNCRRYLDFLEVMDRVDDEKRLKSMRQSKEYDFMNSAFDGLEKLSDSQDENEGKAVSFDDLKVVEMIRRRKDNVKNERKTSKTENASFDPYITLMDAVDMYISKIKYHVNGNEDDVEIDFSGYGFEDTERIIGNFPTAFFTDEKSGDNLINFIRNEFKKKLSKAVPYIKCPNSECNNDIGSKIELHDFFLFG